MARARGASFTVARGVTRSHDPPPAPLSRAMSFISTPRSARILPSSKSPSAMRPLARAGRDQQGEGARIEIVADLQDDFEQLR